MLEIAGTESHHAVIYARTAAGGQAALDAQVERLRAVAARHGWAGAAAIEESRGGGISDEALSRVTGYEFVVLRDLTRLSRNPEQLIATRQRLLARGVRIVLPDGLEDADLAHHHLRMLQTMRDLWPADGRDDSRIVPAHRPSERSEPVDAVDAMAARLQELLRRQEWEAHAERTRLGIAAAKARREARR